MSDSLANVCADEQYVRADEQAAEVVARYEIRYVQHTRCNHYTAWLEIGGARHMTTTGCSIGPRLFGYNRASCERQARRSARKLLQAYFDATDAGDPVTYTLTPEEIA